MNVPAAKDDMITSTISPAFSAKIPIATPSGVAKANIRISYLTSLKSFGKTFTNEIPKALEAAPLWMTIAIIMFKVSTNER